MFSLFKFLNVYKLICKLRFKTIQKKLLDFKDIIFLLKDDQESSKQLG